MENVEYLLVGQGLCGTWLSYYLLKAGKSVMVIDDVNPIAASRIASGVINPITGRRFVKSWRIDTFMPFAYDAYREICEFLHLSDTIVPVSILDIFPSLQMRKAFEKRLSDGEYDYIFPYKEETKWESTFAFDYGIGLIDPAYYVPLYRLLPAWRSFLKGKNSFRQEKFHFTELSVSGKTVLYRDIEAQTILFCDGVAGADNSFFGHLPFAPNKGEVLIASIPELPQNYIYKCGLSIIPWKENLFWIGSTYEWEFKDIRPSKEFKEKVVSVLRKSLKITYEIVDHFAGLRPANTERRPFAGLLAHQQNVGILNGMGTKGCSLAPYYAHQFVQNLIGKSAIDAEADVNRFTV